MTNPRLIELHTLLQKALELEFFTIPPYLTALYSIREESNVEATQIVQSVVMEEMLHMTLVANVMNAVGARPRISPDIVKKDENDRFSLEIHGYPSQPPHVELDVKVSLQRFSAPAIRTFRKIEEPEDADNWRPAAARRSFASIGHFYNVLLDRLIAISVDLGESAVFSGNRTLQIRPEDYYGAGGNVVPVHCLADAKDVITEVAQQGEGRRKLSNLTGDQERFGQPREVAHYYRFQEILVGRYYDRDDDVSLDPAGKALPVDWSAAYPMKDNPKSSSAVPRGVVALLKEFDSTYRQVLACLHRGFNGEQAALREAVPAMHRLKNQSRALMKVETGEGQTHGPVFWYVTLKAR